jgi:hemerythrin-like metal-binding protein
MPTFEWTQNLAVGIDLIDEQHKMLFQRANDVSQSLDSGQGLTQIIKTLDFLIDYTLFHFSTEENHMKANRYTGLEAHQASHRGLINTLNDLERDFKEEGATNQLADALNSFLNNWLVKHIKGIDVQFGKFLKEKNIRLS